MPIIDNHGRVINYLRLAVTDRCNLRCNYCIPDENNIWLPRQELMSYEEMLRITKLLVVNGIGKIRITGGEPFMRKDLMRFINALSKTALKQIAITTNGVLTAPFIPALKECGINSVNLSLDTLNRERFRSITRRDDLPAVLNTLELLKKYDFDIKLNAVVMENKNIDDIHELVELTRNENISVRFIEEMPFNGKGKTYSGIKWNYKRILEHIQLAFPSIQKIEDPPFSTSYNYSISGHKGTVGIIAAYSRSFCGTCNRLRITPQGMLKTCLYDHGVLDVKNLIRNGESDEVIMEKIQNAINKRAVNGVEAERLASVKDNLHESMAVIGG
jgi:molybdenum cofactor biosynthesis protein A